MNFNPERKIRYVQITSEILEKEGIEGVTIRKVAEKAGCTSAVLYKHFENKEHLVMLASVKFLEPYIIEFLKQTDREDITSIQMDLWLWRCFIFEAFRNKPYYELMFFSDQRDMLEECVYEYYQMFPEVQKHFTGLSASIIFSSNLNEREFFPAAPCGQRRAYYHGKRIFAGTAQCGGIPGNVQPVCRHDHVGDGDPVCGRRLL